MGTSYSQNWDGVTPPALPLGWTGDANGVTAAHGFQSSPNCFYPTADAGAGHVAYYTTDGNGGDFTCVQYYKSDLTTGVGPSGAVAYRGTISAGSFNNGYFFKFDQVTTSNQLAISLARVNSGTATVLATVPNVAVSATITLRLTIVANANVHTAEVYNTGTSQYLTSTGTWSSTQQNCINFTDSGGSVITGAGNIGYSWYQNTSGQGYYDDFSITPIAVTATLGTTPINTGSTGTATASGFNGGTVTWTSSNTAVATINSSTGLYTGTGAGTCTFTATGVTNTTQSATTATLTVNNVAATSYTLTAPTPASGFDLNASGNFSVQANGIPSPALVVTPADGGAGGTFTPTSLTLSDSAVHTFVYTPATTGAKTISVTHTAGGFSGDPASVTYTSNARTLAVSPSTLNVSVTTPATFTGGGTKWTSSAPTFTPTDVAGVSIGTVTVVTDTSATANVTTGSTTGTITWTDSTTSATTTEAVAQVVAVNSLAPFGPGYKNLAGTVGVTVSTVIANVVTQVQARTTVGINETVSNASGYYVYQYNGDPGTTYLFSWDTGGSTPIYDADIRLAYVAAAIQTANVTQIAGQTVTAASGVTFPSSVASPTNITAGTITTTTSLTNLPSIPANWLTAAGIAASAMNGKGDWLLSSSYTAPPTAAVIATAVLTDTGDNATLGSPGKILAQLGGAFTTTSSSVLSGASLVHVPAGSVDVATILGVTPIMSGQYLSTDVAQIMESTQAATALAAQALSSFQGVVSNDASPTTTSFSANTTGSTGLSTANGFYATPNSLVVFYSGTLRGKTSYCTGYTVSGVVGEFALGSALPSAPSVADQFFVISLR